MRLVIAEKPSVAAEIARCLGAIQRVQNSEGLFCYKNDSYYVSNALGHLYSIGNPSDYGYSDSKWELDELPIRIDEFKVLPSMSKEEAYNKVLIKQRNLISELINRDDVEEIICATDAGREGELIFRYIYRANSCNKPVKRLWISSLTEESILHGFETLKPDTEYDNMYCAGFARAKADWLVGMNLSRLYSCLDKCTHKVGRVKTPVLNIVAKRDTEIKNFKRIPYFKVILDNGAESEEEFPTGELAASVAKACTGTKANVTSAEIVEKSENRPLLFSLTALQQEANDLYGYTAVETLNSAQTLYEKKLITYPRTDSSYISDDMVNDVAKLVETIGNLTEEYHTRTEKLFRNGLNIDKRVVDNSKISDHHSIIPTKQTAISSSLSEMESNILKLVINRFLCALDKQYKYKEAKYVFWAEDHLFNLTAKQPIELGWKEYAEKKIDDTCGFPEYTANQSVTVNSAEVKSCEKQPPKHYTDSTLLSVMENINNLIDDNALKECIKGKGIGTPATRAGIIEELINNKYLSRSGKQLIATDFGLEFIRSLPESVKSVERTAEWEQILENISSGKCNENQLLDDINRFVALTVESEKGSDRKPMENTNVTEKVSLGKCPRCGRNIYEGKDNYYCETGKDGCNFTIWKQQNSFIGNITAKNVENLLKGKSVSLKTKTKDGEIYTAEFTMEDTGTYVNFTRIKKEKLCIGKCPRCGKDVYDGKSNFYCESGKDGCGFTIWKTYKYPANIEISARVAKDLITKGKAAISIVTLDGKKISKNYKLKDCDGKISLSACE